MPSRGRSTGQFLVELLKHKVTADTAEVLKATSVAALGSAKGGSIAFAWLLIGGFAFIVNAERPFEMHEYIIVAVGVLGAPAGVAGQLCLFIVQCGGTIVRDTVGQVIKQVNMARRAGHADFDQIMDAVDEVDALVSTFSSHIQVPLICMLLLGSVCGSAVLMCALGPQPESADHLWNVLHVSKFLLAIAAMLIMGGISCLALPAAITSQVQALERAINSLRIIRQGECAAMAVREDQDKIATILDYMRQKVTAFASFLTSSFSGTPCLKVGDRVNNRCTLQDLGHRILNKKVTFAFVVVVLTQVGSVMAVAFPMMYSFAAEQGHMNATDL
jgi:hypothetical protein